MPYKKWYENDGTVVYTKYSGDLKYSEVRKAAYSRFADEKKFKLIKIMVVDFSEASMKNISTNDVQKDAYSTKQLADINGDIELIGIMPRDFDYGMGRMWQGYASSIPWHVHLVRSREEARDLLQTLVSK